MNEMECDERDVAMNAMQPKTNNQKPKTKKMSPSCRTQEGPITANALDSITHLRVKFALKKASGSTRRFNNPSGAEPGGYIFPGSDR